MRCHTEILPLLKTWTGEDLTVLGDLGYEGESDTITVPIKKPTRGKLTDDQQTHNKAHRVLTRKAQSVPAEPQPGTSGPADTRAYPPAEKRIVYLAGI